jgi:hypothetical protein
MHKFCWTGNQEAWLNQSDTKEIGRVVLGRLGGMTQAGQTKNEDGFLLFSGRDWEFILLMDAHNSAASAELVASAFLAAEVDLRAASDAENAFHQIPNLVTEQLSNPNFLEACKQVQGETACLFIFRKGSYLWWLSVGDCQLYIFHEQLAQMGEFEQNTRHFYEWIGERNSWALPVPSYTTGTRQLRRGMNRIFLTTDGLLECRELSINGQVLWEKSLDKSDMKLAEELLLNLEKHEVRDSCTFACWTVEMSKEGLMPSDQE